MAVSDLDRFHKFHVLNTANDCWDWQGKKNKDGYGHFYYEGRSRLAHRVSWELHRFGRKIPEGMTIDHLCYRSCCVNPVHLKVRLPEDNRRRKPTHCKRGHEFTPENTLLQPNGRMCRTCRRADWKRYHATTRQGVSA